jgi:hypothetical protein
MNLPKDILLEILYFLDWKKIYKLIKIFKYNIPEQLRIYDKYNNSLKYVEINDICDNRIEYLEIVKYLHSIGKDCSMNVMD